MSSFSAANLKPHEIGFDFDGVIADIGETFLRLMCECYGLCSLKLEDIRTFQVEQCLEVDPASIDRIFDDILDDSLATGLRPMAGAIDTLSRLSVLAPITIITARKKPNPVIDWLDHHCSPQLKGRINLIATGDHDNKERFIRECRVHHFIDDRAVTCTRLFEAGLNPIVYTQPWNLNQHRLPAVADWDEIAKLVYWELPA